MATTTISIRSEAHTALKRARGEGESFSDVILRYVRPPARTGAELNRELERFEGVRMFDPSRLKAIRAGRGRRSNRPTRPKGRHAS
jgi:predicted CopG family antitoxin